MNRPFFLAVRRYFRAAPFPHLTTLGMGAVVLCAVPKATLHLDSGRELTALCLSLLAAGGLWGMVLCQADAFSRYREFKRVRSILRRYGFRPRLFRPVSSSRCQRDAALFAATESGFQHQARQYFRELGYRWYHILPDRIVADPLHLFHPDFLRITFLPRRKARD